MYKTYISVYKGLRKRGRAIQPANTRNNREISHRVMTRRLNSSTAHAHWASQWWPLLLLSCPGVPRNQSSSQSVRARMRSEHLLVARRHLNYCKGKPAAVYYQAGTYWQRHKYRNDLWGTTGLQTQGAYIGITRLELHLIMSWARDIPDTRLCIIPSPSSVSRSVTNQNI